MISKDDFLTKYLEQLTKETFTLQSLIPLIVNNRLSKYGIALNESQVADLLKQVESHGEDPIRLSFNDEQEEMLKNSGVDAENVIDLAEVAETLDQKFDGIVQNSMMDITNLISNKLCDDWLTQLPDELRRINIQNDQYLKRLKNIWGELLDMFRAFIDICTSLGSDFNEVFRPQAANEDDFVFEVLTSAHARCCQISGEIYALLASGFPDGANARWRTLHEQTTIAIFVSEVGSELANRYLLHGNVSRYKRAYQYNKYCKRLGFEPIPNDQMSDLKKTYEALISRFGKNYKSDYGWASDFLGIKRPTFSDIEEHRKADHFRPYIHLSNLNVHGGSESLYLRMGMSPGDKRSLGAGESYFGLGDPLQNAAIALNALTVRLLLSKPSLDRSAIGMALQKYTDKILEKLSEILAINPELRYD